MSKKQHRSSDDLMRMTIEGMHCAACEVLVERRLRQVEGVSAVHVNAATGRAKLRYTEKPALDQLQAALNGTEYSIAIRSSNKTTNQDYWETGRAFLVIVVIYLVAKRFNLIPEGLSVGENMSYGFIFAIGLVAAVSSCLAVTGGLLLAVSGRYAELHPHVSGIKKFRPHLYFNAGRVIGYTVLGGLIGSVGSVFTLSTRLTGVLMIVASLVMIFLGFQLLNIFPGLRRFQPTMPKFIAHRVHNASNSSDHPTGPFVLGAGTFFLPCGFTQALQLYVLAQGSFTVGALTMLAFSLGTLPALLSLSALSSFLKGSTRRHFFRFAGVLVVLLGIANVGNGMALAGTNINLSQVVNGKTVATDLAPIENGKQIIKMKVDGLKYEPAQFTVRQGVPVEWQIDGSEATGCAQVVIAPDLDLTIVLSTTGTKVTKFTPTETGVFTFSCSMGMTTRGAAITVVPNDGVDAPAVDAVDNTQSSANVTSGEAQRLLMTVTDQKGFYPEYFTAKTGTPVVLEIDVQTDVGGCMDTVIGSDYDIAQRLKWGKNELSFTPTKAGVVYLTCPMGIPIAEITITNS